MALPDWRVIIVNYRTGELAARAAASARNALGSRGEVIVVDSASGDDSSARIEAAGAGRLLALPENRGFGAALNAGVRECRTDFILCQNADITYGPELIEMFERRFAEISALAVIGPRLIGENGETQPSCRRFPTHASLLVSRGSPLGAIFKSRQRRYILPEPPSFTLCDVVAGACFVVRRSVWEELEGMDETFFLYAEDTDFCRRAKSAGYLIGYEPAVAATHVWGASTQQDRKRSARLHAQSLSYYLRKHFPNRPFANRLLDITLKLNSKM